jgi:predicted NBD/HSP70 family sugar kinase
VGPVVVEDSVPTMGLNAHRFGPARERENFLYLFVGNGIGAVLFVDGRPYRAATGISGELGHVTVNEQGAWCSCGNRGCLETEAAVPAVLRRVRDRLAASHVDSALRAPFEAGTLTIEALLQAAATGDKIAYQILDETGGYIGRVLAIALNLLGPDLVIFAGPFAHPDSIVVEAMRRQVRLRALKYISRQTQIVCDDQSEFGAARGAALLALDALITSDTYAGLAVARLVSV